MVTKGLVVSHIEVQSFFSAHCGAAKCGLFTKNHVDSYCEIVCSFDIIWYLLKHIIHGNDYNPFIKSPLNFYLWPMLTDLNDNTDRHFIFTTNHYLQNLNFWLFLLLAVDKHFINTKAPPNNPAPDISNIMVNRA